VLKRLQVAVLLSLSSTVVTKYNCITVRTKFQLSLLHSLTLPPPVTAKH